LLWGDGNLLLQYIDGSPSQLYMEYGDLLLHQLLYRLLKILGVTVSGFEVYRWYSIFAGATACLVLYLWTRHHLVDKGLGLLFVLYFLGQGSIMIFFGHPESYSLFYVAVLVFFLASIRVLAGGKIIYAVPAAGLAVFLHLAGIVLIPLIPLVWFLSKERVKISPAVGLATTLLVLTGIVVAAYLLNAQGFSLFLPIWAGATNPYALLSAGHLTDLGNMLALLFPTAILLLFLFGPPIGNDKVHYFLVVSSAVTLFGMSTVDLILEASDWDLFSFAGIPLFLLAFETARRKGIVEQTGRYAGLALAIIIFHTAPWVLSNRVEACFIKQYSLIASGYHHPDRAKLFARATMALTSPTMGINRGAVELANDAISRGFDDPRVWNNLGLAYFNLKKYDSSAAAYKEVVKKDSANVNAWGMLGNLYMQSAAFASAEDAFERVLRYSPDDQNSWLQLAGALMMNGNAREAALVSQKALLTWPDNGKLWAMNAASLLQSGSQDAITAANKALELVPDDPASYVNAGIAYAISGRTANAKEVWHKGAELFPGNQKLNVLSQFSDSEIKREFRKKQ